MRITSFLFATLILTGIASADDTQREIDSVLNGFHEAAARGDRERYLAYMTNDGVFLGTDEWERWPKSPEFTEYVKSRFKNDKGWEYSPVERNLSVHEAGNVAWFDEVVFSETNGRFRGTGVLVRESDTWKIAHYAMSFLVFNENWDAVIKLNKATGDKKANEADSGTE